MTHQNEGRRNRTEIERRRKRVTRQKYSICISRRLVLRRRMEVIHDHLLLLLWHAQSDQTAMIDQKRREHLDDSCDHQCRMLWNVRQRTWKDMATIALKAFLRYPSTNQSISSVDLIQRNHTPRDCTDANRDSFDFKLPPSIEKIPLSLSSPRTLGLVVNRSLFRNASNRRKPFKWII